MHDEFIVFHDLLKFFNLFCVNSCTYKSVADLIKPLNKRESSPNFQMVEIIHLCLQTYRPKFIWPTGSTVYLLVITSIMEIPQQCSGKLHMLICLGSFDHIDEFIVFHDLQKFFNLFCVNYCTSKSVADLIKPPNKRESSPIFHTFMYIDTLTIYSRKIQMAYWQYHCILAGYYFYHGNTTIVQRKTKYAHVLRII